MIHMEKLCVPDVFKEINVKVFNLVSRTNETRSACNNEQQQNKDKCRYECKELINKGICDTGFLWNPSN